MVIYGRDVFFYESDACCTIELCLSSQNNQTMAVKAHILFRDILKKEARCAGEQWFNDTAHVKSNGKQHHLWRAIDQDDCGTGDRL